MKHRDEILDELHKVRAAIGRAHDFDVYRIAATVRRHEAESREPVIHTLPKRRRPHRRAS